MKTEYIVLMQDGNTWIELEGRWDATSTKGAVRHALAALNASHGGLFVAIPTRSWQPHSVKVETQQRLRIG